jgi:DNA-binding CsgD family transcriptional regulator
VRTSASLVAEVVTKVQSCDGAAAFQQETLRILDDLVGFDGALCFSSDQADPPAAIAPPGDGVELARSLRPHLAAIAKSGGLGMKVDADGTTRLLAAIAFHRRLLGGVALWRRASFTRAEVERVRDALAVLGIAWAALARANVPPPSDPQLERFRHQFATLSPREREISGYVARGLRNRDIALVLGISPNTVRNLTCRIFEKTEASGRTELAIWLQQLAVTMPSLRQDE